MLAPQSNDGLTRSTRPAGEVNRPTRLRLSWNSQIDRCIKNSLLVSASGVNGQNPGNVKAVCYRTIIRSAIVSSVEQFLPGQLQCVFARSLAAMAEANRRRASLW